MARQRMTLMFACLLLAFNAVCSADENLTVLPETIDGVTANNMVKHHLAGQIEKALENWRQEYEQRNSPDQIAAYQKRLREKFIEAIGSMPERTPLNPQITGVVIRYGYRVEKIVFESQPKHYVTAALFLPDSDKYKPPYPGVLMPCGHYPKGKAYPPYQTMAALLALNGMAALVFDPIDQGERYHWFGDDGKPVLDEHPVIHHTMLGIGSVLLGQNVAMFEIRDGMRGIDYLQSRHEIDPKRIGCVGQSGGGTQTSYLMALDERIIAAAPACYITNFECLLATRGPDDAEQNIYGQLAFGMDQTDYLMMRAPTPTLICAVTKDTFDIQGTWVSFRYAKRLYSRMGFAERIELIEHDGEHGYQQPLREATARWMSRWLLGKDQAITESDIKLLSEEEIQCTPDGQVMLLGDAKSTFDINRDLNKTLAVNRGKLWSVADLTGAFDRVRKIAGIRKLAELPRPEIQEFGTIKRKNYHIEKLVLKPQVDIYLPALLFVPDRAGNAPAVLYINEKGKAVDAEVGGTIEELVKTGRVVLAVDLRGTGETKQTECLAFFKPRFGADAQDFYLAYLLGKSYVGMRAEDVLVCGRWLLESKTAEKTDGIDLIAIGNVTIPVLHAAALEASLFNSVKLKQGLVSWSNLLELGTSDNQLINAVHGALTAYDLDNLADTLSSKLTIEKPLNALGKEAEIRIAK